MLADLGLTADAEIVYKAVLNEPSWRIRDLVEHLNLTERRVRRALDQLADLQLVRAGVADFDPWVTVSPDVGLTALLTVAESELRQREEIVRRARAAISAIATQHLARRSHVTDTIRIDSLAGARKRLAELTAIATVECLSMTPGGLQMSDAIAAGRPLAEGALGRGVRIMCIYQDSVRNDPRTLDRARGLTEQGGKVRTFPTLPLPMVLFDRTTALLPISPSDAGHGVIEVHQPSVITALSALFNSYWHQAQQLDAPATPGHNGLMAQEQEVLRLLADGHTDETVARRLGVSVRTLRRTIAELSERLSADSRFQFGVLASRRGWL